MIIVPGGGAYADVVREQQRLWQFDDSTAHGMALLAMDQFGYQLAAMGNAEVAQSFRVARHRADLLAPQTLPVWLPSQWVDSVPEVGRNWDITSDSLALWLAAQLLAQGVVLIKSLSTNPGELSADEAMTRGWVDAAFPDLLRRYQVPTWLLGQSQRENLSRLLNGDAHAGLALY